MKSREQIAGLIVSIGLIGGCTADLPAYAITEDRIDTPLTSTSTDPARGQRLFETRSDAHCVLCHAHARSAVLFQGNLGPDLSDVDQRLSSAQIRLRIVDYDAFRPGTTMPSYYRTHGLQQVASEHDGQTVLTAQEIEDIIAFLIDTTDRPKSHDTPLE